MKMSSFEFVSVVPSGPFNFLEILERDPETGVDHRRVKMPGDDFDGEAQEVLDARDDPSKGHTPEVLSAFLSWRKEIDESSAETARRTVGSSREFLKLFTREERLAFWAAEATSPDLKDWWAMASTGDFWLGHPSVEAGLSGLVASGILAADRAEEILGADFDQG